MVKEKYSDLISVILQECPDADEEEIGLEFERYEKEFLIPPEDALRSVLRKFQISSGVEVENSSAQPSRIEKKVERFSELDADDKNVTIEVSVVNYNPRVQKVRGEDRQIAFGWIEDRPWNASSERERWEFKDWGQKNETLIPGSIVRLEGVSVNEWNGKKSININQTSRVTIVKEGISESITISSEPLTINRAIENEGFVDLVARIISVKPDKIVRRDGSGEIEIFRGILADLTGSTGFLSWKKLEFRQGDLIKIKGASVRKFRDTPEINFNDGTIIEIYHDSEFASLEELANESMKKIADLRNGMKGISITLQVESWNERKFIGNDGEEKIVRSGDVMDPTGRCRLTAWCEINPSEGDFVHLEGARVQYWQGSPDLVIDDLEQVTNLSDQPWDKIDPENHWIQVELSELVNGGSRRGIETSGTIVSVRNDSGIIERCSECRRVLRENNCPEHGDQIGEEDLRLRFVVDNGISNASLLMAKESAEEFLGMKMQAVKDEISKSGRMEFVTELRNKCLSRKVSIRGRSIVDDQGAMILSDITNFSDIDPKKYGKKIMEKWGLVI